MSVFRPLVEDPDPPSPAEIEADLARRGRSELWRLAVAGSAEECVSAFFESEEVRGAFASQGIIGTAASPRHPGTAWILTYHQLGGELNGADGTWAYVRGGMGSVTQALSAAAARAGAVVRTEAGVASVLVDEGRAVGVRLEDGEELRADAVLSNADPLRTFLGLLPAGTLEATFEDRVRAWRTDGVVVKVNLALAELPEYTARPGRGPQHEGTLEISPSIGYLHRAWEESAAGAMSSEPFMEVFLQTAVDPGLAPEGCHVASAFTQYAPAAGAVDHAGALETVLRTAVTNYVTDAGERHKMLRSLPEIERRTRELMRSAVAKNDKTPRCPVRLRDAGAGPLPVRGRGKARRLRHGGRGKKLRPNRPSHPGRPRSGLSVSAGGGGCGTCPSWSALGSASASRWRRGSGLGWAWGWRLGWGRAWRLGWESATGTGSPGRARTWWTQPEARP